MKCLKTAIRILLQRKLKRKERPKRKPKTFKLKFLNWAAVWPSVLFVFAACGNPSGGSFNDGIDISEHRIFVTSIAYSGDLGGLEGADDKCKSAASSAGLVRQYRAILSDDGITAKNRLNLIGPVYLFSSDGNKEKVVELGQDLWGTAGLLIPVDRDEFGTPRFTDVWSGTDTDGGNGVDFSNCQGWTSSSSDQTGTYGVAGQAYGAWIEDGGNHSCDGSYSLYCISQ